MVKLKYEPKEADLEVGRRIRLYRNMLGITQTKLAGDLGISFQQIQKYEKGINRVGASRLQSIANCLSVPVSAFFSLSDSGPEQANRQTDAFGQMVETINSTEGMELNQAFARITNPMVRSTVLALVDTLAARSNTQTSLTKNPQSLRN